MSSPSYYAPRTPSALDTVQYTQRVVDSMLRNNPLHNATVDRGLMRWVGNYVGDSGDRINYLWIGEFRPSDANLPGNPPQKGFSLVRDDSRGGQSAISLYDPNSEFGDGLKQRLGIGSGDGQRLFEEAREGGWRWPEDNVWMGARDSNVLSWPGTTSGAFDTIYEGRVNIVGNQIAYRVFDATTGGASANFRMRVEGVGPGGTDAVGPTHSLGVNQNNVHDSVVNVTGSGDGRGRTVAIYWEGQVTNAVGKAHTSIISVRCYTG